MQRSESDAWRRRAGALLGCVAIAAAAPMANAQDEPIAEQQALGLSIVVAPGVRYLQLPQVYAGLFQGSNPAVPFGATPDSALGWGIDGVIAYSLGERGALVGKRAEVALRVRTSIANAAQSLVMPNGQYGQMPVDGSGPSLGIAVLPFATAESSIDYGRYDFDLVYRGEVSFDAPVRLRPLLGVAYSRLSQDLAFHTDPFNGFEIQDALDTNSIGGVIGLESSFELPFGLYLDLGFESDLLAGLSTLTSTQNFGGPILTAADDPAQFLWRVRGALGFGWVWRERLGVGLSGTADWGRTPVVVHPLFDSDPFESFVDTGDSLVVGGNLTFSVAF